MPRKKDAAGRTFGFVRMASESPAEKVIVALNGTVALGRKLQVNSGFFFQRKEALNHASRSTNHSKPKVAKGNMENLQMAGHANGTQRQWADVVQKPLPTKVDQPKFCSFDRVIEMMTTTEEEKKIKKWLSLLNS